jgi:hypothetical protein
VKRFTKKFMVQYAGRIMVWVFKHNGFGAITFVLLMEPFAIEAKLSLTQAEIYLRDSNPTCF